MRVSGTHFRKLHLQVKQYFKVIFLHDLYLYTRTTYVYYTHKMC
jgi:hypothetical protein